MSKTSQLSFTYTSQTSQFIIHTSQTSQFIIHTYHKPISLSFLHINVADQPIYHSQTSHIIRSTHFSHTSQFTACTFLSQKIQYNYYLHHCTSHKPVNLSSTHLSQTRQLFRYIYIQIIAF